MTDRITRYVCVGGTVALFQYVTFFVTFGKLELPYLYASNVTFMLTVCVSYLLQRNVTFEKESDKKTHTTQFVYLLLFVGNALLGLIFNGFVMYTGVEVFHISAYITQIVSMVLVAAYNFFIYRLLLS